MAQKTVIQLIDDLDGSTSESIESIAFSLDGVNYEIDLNETNAAALRNGLSDFVAAGRRVGGRVKRGAPTAKPAGQLRSKEQTRAIREWAKSAGHDVSERGRIPSAVIEAFEEAHSGRSSAA